MGTLDCTRVVRSSFESLHASLAVTVLKALRGLARLRVCVHRTHLRGFVFASVLRDQLQITHLGGDKGRGAEGEMR